MSALTLHDRARHEAQRLLDRHDTTHSIRRDCRDILALLVAAFMAGHARGRKEVGRG
jgi:hypothetical protein